MSERQDVGEDPKAAEARRDFLKRCGKYAVVTPPAVTLMLSAASRPAKAGIYGNVNSANSVRSLFSNRAQRD